MTLMSPWPGGPDGPGWALPLAVLSLVAAGLLALGLRSLRAGLGRTTAHLEGLGRGQQELLGRVGQLTEGIERSMALQTRQLSDGLTGQVQQAQHAGRTLAALGERLAVIDAAQRRIAELSEQVVKLQEVLGNKQARGAFGEVQLENLVVDALPPSAYGFQVVLGNGRRADCVVRLPQPPGPIAIDAKFPLESYHALRAAPADPAAARAFAAALKRHVVDVAERYIVPGETAESALLFLPSEAVYAEVFARFPQVVEEGFRRRVWIVSPTTLMATLHTVRAVLKDARMREAAGAIQREVRLLLDDVVRLDERVARLSAHVAQAEGDLAEIRKSTDKVLRRADRIEQIEVEPPAAAALAGVPPPPGRAVDQAG